MILFYSEDLTPRIQYIAQVIFSEILNIEVSFTNNSNEFQNFDLPKINYSNTKFGNEIFIKPHGLLQENTISKPTINPVDYLNEKYFFESSDNSLFPFDPFAAAFYLVSRYEEYNETELDKFNRYPASKSILSRYNLLQKPVVNIWAKMLKNALTAKYPTLVFPENKFKFISTIDIDNAWAYLNKGFWRTGGAIFKSLFSGNFSEILSRVKVLVGKEKDPYDTYNYLNSVFSGNEEKVKFFFLLGDYDKFDKNVSHKNVRFQKLIQNISLKYDIGIHPSVAGFIHGCHGKVIRENIRLEIIIGKKVLKSRNHYLNLKFPNTYQNLIKAGISEDYTMGYPDQTGFRAGICTPFHFYDLENESVTNLRIVPFQIMDGTLQQYLRLSPKDAWDELEKIMQEVKNVEGTFVSIWHNETVNNQGDWKGFREVFEKMNHLGFKWANE